METETEQIFKEQLGKLPAEVVDFISSASWEENLDEIAALYNLPEKEQGDFKLEVTLVLAGLIPPDAPPDNFPFAEKTEPLLPLVPFKLDEESTEPLIPPIPPKTPHLEASLPSEVAEPPHPFEEKMKQVFTAGMQPMVAPKNELMTETQTPSVYNNTIKPLTPP